jgi:uracil phosphoribosyltransferase
MHGDQDMPPWDTLVSCDGNIWKTQSTQVRIRMSQVHVIDHPLVQHKLSKMRNKETPSKDFRDLLNEIGMLMGYEVTRNLETKKVTVETPVAVGEFEELADDNVVIVPILRAGIGMQAGLQNLMPFAHVGHIGLYRVEDENGEISHVQYYCKMPKNIAQAKVIIVDPMLATGGSSIAAIANLKDLGCSDISLMCLVAAPEGIEVVQNAHDDVDIYVAAIDQCLNEHAYIIPGLGDAGDRIFGTK